MHYKFIFLIIDSDTHSAYIPNRNIIKRYMNSFMDIKAFFIRLDATQVDDILINEDTIIMKGTESLIPGILQKTLMAMKYIYENFDVDFIIRSNMSTFWDYKYLLELHKSLPKTNLVHAVNCYISADHEVRRGDPHTQHIPVIYFPRGCGIIVSCDIARLCVENAHMIYDTLPDDVALGYFLYTTRQIKPHPGGRIYYFTDRFTFDNDTLQTILEQKHYQYRIKYPADRTQDNMIFELLYEKIYK